MCIGPAMCIEVRLDGHFCAVHAVADMLRSVCLTDRCLYNAVLNGDGSRAVRRSATTVRRHANMPSLLFA